MWDENPALQAWITREAFLAVATGDGEDEHDWVNELFTTEISALYVFMGRPEADIPPVVSENLSKLDKEGEPVVFATTDGSIQVLVGVVSTD